MDCQLIFASQKSEEIRSTLKGESWVLIREPSHPQWIESHEFEATKKGCRGKAQQVDCSPCLFDRFAQAWEAELADTSKFASLGRSPCEGRWFVIEPG